MNKIDLIIDALENCKGLTQIDRMHLKKALAAARELKALKPVAWAVGRKVATCDEVFAEIWRRGGEEVTPLYTAPPRKEWVSLSDTEINKIVDLNTSDDGGFDIWCDGVAVAHIVCAKLKELNK